MIKGYTINNARQMGIANETGSIEVGKSADLVILPANIFETDVYDISEIEPSEVYFKGNRINNK